VQEGGSGVESIESRVVGKDLKINKNSSIERCGKDYMSVRGSATVVLQHFHLLVRSITLVEKAMKSGFGRAFAKRHLY
jgi:hypothetical protein